MSRAQAGDDPPTDVSTRRATATASSWTGCPAAAPPYRLASHRLVRSASASIRGSSGDQSNAASYSR
ncbi:MAG TPA: hypothetical protein VIY52_11555 [Streptosporangiaceae bacterium]